MNLQRRLAWLVAFYALAVMAAGAVQWPLHADFGFGLVAATVVLGVWCLRGKQPLLRGAGGVALAASALECVPGAAMIHACFAPVLFAAVALIAILGNAEPADVGHEAGSASTGLGWVSAAMPPLVFLQITLGAAYRHKLMGVMTHMGGALLVSGTILVTCVLILQRCPDRLQLRRAATAAIGIVLLQVSLGIAVFILRLLDSDNSTAFAAVAAIHICGAASLLTASAWLSVRYPRS